MKKDKIKKSKAEMTPTELKRRKKKRTRIIIILVIIALIVIRFVACSGGGNAAAMVTTAKPTYGDVDETVSISGSVDSEETKVYFSPVNGRIGEVKVEAGDEVQKGDMLIAYDMESMADKLREAQLQAQIGSNTYNGSLADSGENQSKLNEANTNLKVLDQQIADSEAYAKKLQETLDKSVSDTTNSLAKENLDLSAQLAGLQEELKAATSAGDTATAEAKQKEIQSVQASQARNQYVTSVAGSSDYVNELKKKIADEQEKIVSYKEYKAKMESQKSTSEPGILDSYQKSTQSANFEISSLSVESVQKDYEEADKGLVAEFNGIVTDVTAVNGATVPEGTQMLMLKSSDDVKVTISVTKNDLEKLELGQKAELTISGNTYQGSISKINRMASVNNSGAIMVGAEIHIENPDEKIYLGIEAKAKILTHQAKNVLLIPIEAINADKEGDFVYVEEKGIVVKKPVVTGISSDNLIEIKEGITETDNVIVTSYSSIEEGMSVTAVPAE